MAATDKYNLRFAGVNDAKAISELYDYYVRYTTATFEITPPDAEEFAARISDTTAYYPYLVCECDGKPVAYAYASRYKEREAYCFDVSASIYINVGHHGKKIGTALYTALFEMLSHMGFINVYVGITLPNDKSLGIHRAFGFEEIGVFQKTGYKMGKWLDLVWLVKQLAPYHENPAPTKSIHEIDNALKFEILKRAAIIMASN